VREKPVFKTKEQKRREAEERQARSQARKAAQAQAEKLEQEIAALEERQRALVTQIETGAGNLIDLNRQLVEVLTALEAKNAAWEAVALQLA
jgi:ATP-binding cassette subfamily F protein 3